MRRILFPLLLALLCASCSDDNDSEPLSSSLRRVVIVYMMGENSLSSFSTDDLNEIRAGAAAIPSDCRMVVFIDNSSTTATPQILSFDSVHGEQLLYEYPSDVVSTDGATLAQALQYIIDSTPAQEYALILWSHGSGWMPSSSKVKAHTIGIDNGNNTTSNSGQEMEISTLREVLTNIGIEWKYIFYDACFMQCIEVAYELRHLTQWSLASPAEIPDRGAPYDTLMPAFFAATTFANDIVENYYNTYSSGSGMLISAVRSDALDALAQATRSALATVASYPPDDIQAYCAYASATGYKPEFYDMGSCIYHWLGQSGYEVWRSAATTAVPYAYFTPTWLTAYTTVFTARLTDGDHVAGVSMYVPVAGRTTLNAAYESYEWYDDVGYLLAR